MLTPEVFLPEIVIERASARLLARARAAELWDGEGPIPIELMLETLCGLSLAWAFKEPPPGEILPGWTRLSTRTVFLNLAHKELLDGNRGLEHFTLAHEAGHHELHVDTGLYDQPLLPLTDALDTLVCRVGDGNRREVQAEMFAARLLMPEDLVRRRASQLDTTTWTNVRSVANHFEVSPTAMKNRLRGLGYRTPLTPNTPELKL